MDPTSKRFFSAWLAYRGSKDPRAAIGGARRSYWLMGITMPALAGVLSFVFPEISMFVVGICLGILIGFLVSMESRLAQLQKNWPVLEEVVHWELLQKKIKEDT